MSWTKRQARLGVLLNSSGDEDEDALALDRILHGQSVIGQSSKTRDIETQRFSDRDLSVVGTLERGQFGVVDLVTCKLDGRVYARKSVEKCFALRTRDQCSPILERTILLRALRTSTPWSPHLFCAFQTSTHLNIVMDYADGGSLQDLLESSPHDGRITEGDMFWWAPQIISAIAWCHEEGFVHRDIKPNNFVLKSSAHLLLVDFGSAAPLLPPRPDGSRAVPKEHCVVPCGTCDYISPEILVAHERALVRLEMELDEEDDQESTRRRSMVEDDEEDGYGAETDWWSFGAMLYEMAYGSTPFYAESVRHTYVRIMDHQTSLTFDKSTSVSEELRSMLSNLLTSADIRLGRSGAHELKEHPYLSSVVWRDLHLQSAPSDLHTPQFTYTPPVATTSVLQEDEERSRSQGFAFSALFQSSSVTASPGLGSIVQNTPGLKSILRTPSILRGSPLLENSLGRSSTAASIIGFSWGPRLDLVEIHRNSLSVQTSHRAVSPLLEPESTPRAKTAPLYSELTPRVSAPVSAFKHRIVTPMLNRNYFITPARPFATTPLQPGIGTVPRTSTLRRRMVSDREAMKQLINCVGMSARKKVLESGRKPRILASELFVGMRSRSGSQGSNISMNDSRSRSRSGSWGRSLGRKASFSSVRKELRFVDPPLWPGEGSATRSMIDQDTNVQPLTIVTQPFDGDTFTEDDTGTDTSVPPSPSPSPRPGSAMSMMSSRRSGTPTVTTFSSSLSLRAAFAMGAQDRNPRSPTPTEEVTPRIGPTIYRVARTSPRLAPSDETRVVHLPDMESRHSSLMADIESLQSRLNGLRCTM